MNFSAGSQMAVTHGAVASRGKGGRATAPRSLAWSCRTLAALWRGVGAQQSTAACGSIPAGLFRFWTFFWRNNNFRAQSRPALGPWS